MPAWKNLRPEVPTAKRPTPDLHPAKSALDYYCSTLDIVGRKDREAARIITGCVMETRKEVVMIEAGLIPIVHRVKLASTLQHEMSTRLPREIPAHQTSVDYVPLRLVRRGTDRKEKIMSPRETAWKSLCNTDLEGIPKEEILLTSSAPPWKWQYEGINLFEDLEGCSGKTDTDENLTKAITDLMAKIKDEDVVCYTDGSCEEGAGAVVKMPECPEETLVNLCGVW